VIELATKSTHSKKNYNRQKLVSQLSDIVDVVQSQPVMVVHKNQLRDTYTVLDYLTRQPAIVDLPTRDIADRYCDVINAGRRLTSSKLTRLGKLLNDYYHYDTECEQFAHAYHHQEDEVSKNALFTRLDIADAQRNRLHKEILYLL